MIYRYHCKYRPPMPGGIPSKGLQSIDPFNTPQIIQGIRTWGYANYSRPLTDKEIIDYELEPSPNNPTAPTAPPLDEIRRTICNVDIPPCVTEEQFYAVMGNICEALSRLEQNYQ